MKRAIFLLAFVPMIMFSQGEATKENQVNNKQEGAAKKEKKFIYQTYPIVFPILAEIKLDGTKFNNQDQRCPVVYCANYEEIKYFNACTEQEYYLKRVTEDGVLVLTTKKK